MNKQFHVHSVNQWVACRQQSESMSSSLIDRLDRHQHMRSSCVHAAHAQTKPDGAHWSALRCVRAWAKDFLLSARARAPLRPVALLPELRRIVTRLDMPALRASPASSAARSLGPTHTTPRAVRTLNYHREIVADLICSYRLSIISTVAINLNM